MVRFANFPNRKWKWSRLQYIWSTDHGLYSDCNLNSIFIMYIYYPKDINAQGNHFTWVKIQFWKVKLPCPTKTSLIKQAQWAKNRSRTNQRGQPLKSQLYQTSKEFARLAVSTKLSTTNCNWHPTLSVMIDDHLRQNFIILCQALWMDLEGGEVQNANSPSRPQGSPLLYLSRICPHHLWTRRTYLKDLPCSVHLGAA